MMFRIVLICFATSALISCRDTNGGDPPSQEELQAIAKEVLTPQYENESKDEFIENTPDSLITDSDSLR